MGLILSTAIIIIPFMIGFTLGVNWGDFPGDKKSQGVNTEKIEEKDPSIRKLIMVGFKNLFNSNLIDDK